MISCDNAKSMLSDFLENNLNPATYSSIEQHLEHCEDCRRIFNNVRFLNERIKTVHKVKASSEFDRNLRHRILDHGQDDKPFLTVRGFSFGFSGAAVIAAATFLVFNTFSTQTPATHSIAPAKSMISSQKAASAVVVQNPVAAQKSGEQNLALKDSLNAIPVPIDKKKIKLAEQEK